MDDKLNFQGGNPGAVMHGNFINYYQFHPPENRMKILPTDIWNVQSDTGKGNRYLALDVGCNAGDLTNQIHLFLKNMIQAEIYTLGIDIDPTLVERAQEKRISENLNFKCLDFMDTHKRDTLLEDYLKPLKSTKFDMIFCFSTTMWIHLNNGDIGLKTFLRDLCKMTNNLLIEPQPWKCYKSAVKRMKLSNQEFPLFNEIKIRSNVEDEIDRIVLEMGFIKHWETNRTEWGRKICIYKKST